MARVVEDQVPKACEVFSSLRQVDFCDAYRAPVSKPGIGPQEVYEAVFDHPPSWVRHLFTVRGWMASALRLKHVHLADASGEPGRTYSVGQRAGMFSVVAINTNELIVGDDDTHLNFRISVYRSSSNGAEAVTISTAVQINNFVGTAYMAAIKPFHKHLARLMLQRAVDAGRL